MRKLLIIGVLLSAGTSVASATEFCANLTQGFANEMKRIENGFNQRKTPRERCTYGRGAALATERSILARILANQQRCDAGGAEVKFARDNLKEMIATVEKNCRDAGV